MLGIFFGAAVLAAPPTDRLIAVATDEDVFLLDIDGGGHPEGPLGIGPTEELDRSSDGAWLYGTGEDILPFVVYAGHTTFTWLWPSPRVLPGRVLDVGPQDAQVWGDNHDVVVADFHAWASTGMRAHDPSGGYGRVLDLAVDVDARHLWVLLDHGTTGQLLRLDTWTGAVDRPWASTQDRALLLDAHVNGGVVLVTEDASLPTGDDRPPSTVPTPRLVHVDETGERSATTLSRKGEPTEVEVDPLYARVWVLLERQGAFSADLTGGLRERSFVGWPHAETMAVDRDGAIWFASPGVVGSVSALGEGEAYRAAWQGELRDMVVLEARQGLGEAWAVPEGGEAKPEDWELSGGW
jgi:hypothetical protein